MVTEIRPVKVYTALYHWVPNLLPSNVHQFTSDIFIVALDVRNTNKIRVKSIFDYAYKETLLSFYRSNMYVFCQKMICYLSIDYLISHTAINI